MGGPISLVAVGETFLSSADERLLESASRKEGIFSTSGLIVGIDRDAILAAVRASWASNPSARVNLACDGADFFDVFFLDLLAPELTDADDNSLEARAVGSSLLLLLLTSSRVYAVTRRDAGGADRGLWYLSLEEDRLVRPPATLFANDDVTEDRRGADFLS
jgi:hypothetical protein